MSGDSSCIRKAGLTENRMIENLLKIRLHIAGFFQGARASASSLKTYRAFRADRIAEAMSLADCGEAPEAVTSFTQRRLLISTFRSYVDSHDLSQFERSTAEASDIARALGIPRIIPVFPSMLLKGSVLLASTAMSEPRKVQEAAQLLRKIRSREGREHAYYSLIYLLCGQPGEHQQRRKHLSDSLAFLLSAFDGFESQEQLHALAFMPLPLLQAAKLTGSHCPAALLVELQPLKTEVSADAVLILAEECALHAGLASVREYVSRDYQPLREKLSDAEDFRETVRLLKRAGVAPEKLILLLHQTWHLAPVKLSLRLRMLAEHGVTDVDTLFGAIGQLLWTSDLEVLRFLILNVGIRDSAVLGKMNKVLAERQPPRIEVVRKLLSYAKGPEVLAEAQALLIATAGMENPPVERIDHLMCAPHNLSFTELNNCAAYLTHEVNDEAKFRDFLQTLSRHRLSSSTAVMQFQPCFKASRSAATVDTYIRLARQHVANIDDKTLAEFVEEALGANERSLMYLIEESKITITNFKDLNKLIRLAVVSTDVLRYLVRERRIETATSLTRWFYKEGEGVQDYHGDSTYGDFERLLFVDCTRRAAFFRLKQNMHGVWGAIIEFATTRAPTFDWNWDENQRSHYQAEVARYREEARLKVVDFLPSMLARTGGIVLTSALTSALEGRDLKQSLDALAPMLGSLIRGLGPTNDDLSPMQAEAVGLIYGVTQEQVKEHWPKVKGYEHHLNSVTLAPSYPMVWSKKRYSLPGFTHLQEQGVTSNFGALAAAAKRTRQIKESKAPASLIQNFRLKVLSDSAAVAPALADWLALLLSICADVQTVRNWVDQTLESYEDFLERPHEAHKRILALQTFMGGTLPDEVAANVHKYVSTLNEDLAAVLLKLLPTSSSRQAEISTRDQLHQALRDLSDKVLPVFQKWIATLIQKFESEKKDLPDSMEVTGVITKHPAAFYCRYKFGLCTRANTEMWQEKRHSHLVVFDDRTKTLVGMAMMYFQPIKGYYGEENCLVVRAINLRSPDDIEVEATTAIDEIVRVATTIAVQNNYAAVLFPRSSTLFSNQSFVETASYKAEATRDARALRLANNTHMYGGRGQALFYCKAEAASDGGVDELYVAWERTVAPTESDQAERMESVE